MVRGFTKTDEVIENINLVSNGAKIYMLRQWNAINLLVDWTNKHDIHWSSYKIKETDMRVKTASFTSPQYLDLTNGSYVVLITSPYHENFSGKILSSEYDKKTGLYTYQCQDWSRKYQSKFRMSAVGISHYDIIRFLLCATRTEHFPPTNEELEIFKTSLSGLRPASEYKYSDWGGILNLNPMTNNSSLLIKNKRIMDVIRDLIWSQNDFVDIYFNDIGVLQIEPYNGRNFKWNYFWMSNKQISEIKTKFDITNIITLIDTYEEGDNANFTVTKKYQNKLLESMFGSMGISYEMEKQPQADSGGTKSTNSNSGGDVWKRKTLWIVADGGSGDFKNEVANLMKNKGWRVHVGGTGPGYHYTDYFNVTSDYEVYAMVCNGFCAGSMREAYSTKIQNVLKKKNVTLCTIFDTRGWTNPNGMKPYRYGNFTGYSAGRAWDDNFSSSDPSIRNVADWLCKNHAVYCADPTPSGCVDQLVKGGWFKANNWNC